MNQTARLSLPIPQARRSSVPTVAVADLLVACGERTPVDGVSFSVGRRAYPSAFQ
jgi:hypothetical protein